MPSPWDSYSQQRYGSGNRTRFQVTIKDPNKLFVFDKTQLKRVMRAAGAEVLAAARAQIRKSHGTGRTYYAPGKHRASAPGEAPVSASGALLKSLKVRPFKSGLGVAIRAGEFYALFLEGGAQGGTSYGGARQKRRSAKFGPDTRTRIGLRNTYDKRTRERLSLVGRRVLLPRPFLSAALERKRNSLGERIGAAVEQGIAFKKQT